MNSSTKNLLEIALSLPEGERLALAEALIVSVQASEQPPFDEAWQAEIRRRSAEIDSGKVVPIPWSEVRNRARELDDSE